MELSKVRVQRFKRVEDVAIELGKSTILVGGNGSGKSSILQALHLASCMTRQADRVDKDKPNTVSITELDYLPTNQYKKLGHNADWGNRKESAGSVVRFGFTDPAGDAEAEITLRSARNAGLSVSGSIPATVANLLRAKDKFFTCYVPGLSGIPNTERRESKRVVLRASSFGDSNVYLRNILLLLKTEKPAAIHSIETYLAELIDPIQIVVEHDNEKDLEIRCYFERGGSRNQIELLGTGYLQVIQMLSYIYLFEPGLLLIDEPDTHLHPSAQERLVDVLERAAAPFSTKIVMTTHSPFIVRGAGSDAKVYWLENGGVLTGNRFAAEQALGWGAMGKKVLLISEDGNLKYLRRLIRQWPTLERKVAVLPGTGFRHLPSPAQAEELYEGLEHSLKIAVLRDSDALTPAEKAALSQAYDNDHVRMIFTAFSDIEHYAAQADVQAKLTGEQVADVEARIAAKIEQHKQVVEEMFRKRRKAHNEELHSAQGGAPLTDDLWTALGQASASTVKGKFLLKQLRSVLPLKDAFAGEEDCFDAACDGTLGLDLKQHLEQLAG